MEQDNLLDKNECKEENLQLTENLNSEFELNLNYEIIDRSDPAPINYRKIRLTWGEYFKKLYNVSLIILISFVIYFYYIYGKTNMSSHTHTHTEEIVKLP